MTNDPPPQSQPPKWQPVLLILSDGKRLQCKCGALAIIVSGKVVDTHEDSEPEEGYNQMENVDVWCQACFDQAMREED